ncbi:Gfo/Idh/MocA family protein [Aquibacillus saliphilus]|uniref:Gfo/Idh/MocA family protein n=1 Tax=Aquibacillus saliphilus TaxID=1909422 RepID=UPI001CEFF1DA|nr:Gfo/Idh/MocA family oxidoreductase [Aquibacillus saliphilus]
MRVGIIGYGFIGKLHLLAWKGVEPKTTFCVIDPVLTDEIKLELEQRNIPYMDTFEKALAKYPDIQYISVCSPPNRHKEVVLRAAKENIHILLEKPVSAVESDYKTMKLALSESKSKAMVGVTQRFYPEVIRGKKWIENGLIGDIISIQDIMILSDFGLPSWYNNPDISGGGIFICNGVHLLDRLKYLTGSEIEKLYDYKFKGPVRNEKIASINGKLSGGVNVHLHLEWSEVEKRQELTIFGTKGRIEISTWDYARLYTKGGLEEVKPYKSGDSFNDRTLSGLVNEIKCFLDGVENTIPHELTLEGHESIIGTIWKTYQK